MQTILRGADTYKSLLSKSFSDKVEVAKAVIKNAYLNFKNPVVLFSGGLDSCAMLSLILMVRSDPILAIILPQKELPCIHIFIRCVADKFHLKLVEYRKEIMSVAEFVKTQGCPVWGKEALGLAKDNEYQLPIGSECKHYFKLQPQNNFLKENTYDCYFLGTRADESGLRKSSYLRSGFMTTDDLKLKRIKPLSIFTREETYKLAIAGVGYCNSYYDKIGGINYGTGCYFCGDCFDQPYSLWSYLREHDRDVFNQLFYDYGQLNNLIRIVEFDNQMLILSSKARQRLDNYLCDIVSVNTRKQGVLL